MVSDQVVVACRNFAGSCLDAVAVLQCPIEGAVLYAVDADSGLTESDFITVAGVISTAATIIRVRHDRTDHAPNSRNNPLNV